VENEQKNPLKKERDIMATPTSPAGSPGADQPTIDQQTPVKASGANPASSVSKTVQSIACLALVAFAAFAAYKTGFFGAAYNFGAGLVTSGIALASAHPYIAGAVAVSALACCWLNK
jgi:hypothetical protein